MTWAIWLKLKLVAVTGCAGSPHWVVGVPQLFSLTDDLFQPLDENLEYLRSKLRDPVA